MSDLYFIVYNQVAKNVTITTKVKMSSILHLCFFSLPDHYCHFYKLHCCANKWSMLCCYFIFYEKMIYSFKWLNRKSSAYVSTLFSTVEVSYFLWMCDLVQKGIQILHPVGLCVMCKTPFCQNPCCPLLIFLVFALEVCIKTIHLHLAS